MQLRFLSSILLLTFMVLVISSCSEEEENIRPSMLNSEDSVSYVLGVDLGKSLKKEYVEVNPDWVAYGVFDGLYGDSLLISDSMMVEIMIRFDRLQKAVKQKRLEELSDANKKAAQEFFEELKSDLNVTETASGLMYQVKENGTGRAINLKDNLKVHYTGKLLDGTVFIDTRSETEPSEVSVLGAFPGMQEALMKMKVGSHWEIYVPSMLAYGPQGLGDMIGPDAALIYDVEVIEIIGHEEPEVNHNHQVNPGGQNFGNPVIQQQQQEEENEVAPDPPPIDIDPMDVIRELDSLGN